MNSQLPTSYTLWGLSRRYLALIRGDLTIAPIINDVELSRFFAQSWTAKIREVRRVSRHTVVVPRNISGRYLQFSALRQTQKDGPQADRTQVSQCALQRAPYVTAGHACEQPSLQHSPCSMPVCAKSTGRIFVKISGIVGGHRGSAISQKRWEFLCKIFGKRGSNFPNSTPSKKFYRGNVGSG